MADGEKRNTPWGGYGIGLSRSRRLSDIPLPYPPSGILCFVHHVVLLLYRRLHQNPEWTCYNSCNLRTKSIEYGNEYLSVHTTATLKRINSVKLVVTWSPTKQDGCPYIIVVVSRIELRVIAPSLVYIITMMYYLTDTFDNSLPSAFGARKSLARDIAHIPR